MAKPMTITFFSRKGFLRRLLVAISTAALCILGGMRPAIAAPLSLSEVPLVTGGGVPANILVTFDDSGSMAWAYIPDGLWVEPIANSRRFKSADFNPMYYNPNVTYLPPVDENGTPLTTSFTNAPIDGFNPSLGTMDLSSQYQPTIELYLASWCGNWNPDIPEPWWTWSSSCHYVARNPAADFSATDQVSGVPAYYYVFDNSLPGCSGSIDDDDCYRKVDVSSTSGPGGTDERQNFAIWYSFYRTRSLMVRTAASRAFSRVGGNLRLGWQNLHSCSGFSTSCADFLGNLYDSQLRTFSGTHRQNFYEWLFRVPTEGNTPLRLALNRAGQEYQDESGVDSPYALEPFVTENPKYGCRQNFHIALTDGLRNGPTPSGIGDHDNQARTLPDGTSYSPAESSATAHPYHDPNSVTLADISFYYWANDLAGTINDQVPPYIVETDTNATVQYWNPKNDPAGWQHMVNFFIALGLKAFLGSDWGGDTYSGAYPDFRSGTRHWPSSSDCSSLGLPSGCDRVFDLWHAALNSRGQFFSAQNPIALTNALESILGNIADRTAAASAPSLSSGSIVGGARLFQARFQTGDWTGELLAYDISDGSGSNACNSQPPGTVCTPAVWNARDTVETQAASHDTLRRIITYKPSTGTGIPFRWPSNPSSPGANELDASQINALNKNPSTGTNDGRGNDRLNYIRGASVTGFRPRTWRLGDIVHSAPVYVGPVPDLPYPDTIEATAPYSSFRGTIAGLNGNTGRRPMVYVGANDGMLHAFDANTGQEIFAYVPAAVFGKLNRLTDPAYGHTYYVDGQISVVDAYINGAWRTVLVSTLGGGGQGLFAIDVTNPDNFVTGESTAAANVLWEFTDKEDQDLGYTYGAPSIVKLQNGDWAVIVGNGYNNTVDNAGDGASGDSTTGNAVLYIIRLSDGTLLKKIDTGVGTADDPEGLGRPNGLATPAVVDVDGDFIADYVYAGDLFGNLWRFDLTANTPGGWRITPVGAGGGQPLFKAESPDTPPKAQPITVQPMVSRHPGGLGGLMIYFGTGKYIETGDNSATGQTTQSFYAIWDKDPTATATTATVSRSELLQQKILQELTTTVGGQTNTVRQTTSNLIDWSVHKGWYMDLIVDGSSDNKGERVISNAVLYDNRVIFVSIQPDDDPCDFGGTSWLMELSLESGSRLTQSPFDLNADGLFTTADFVTFPSGSGSVSEAAGGVKLKGIAFGPSIGVTKPTAPCTGSNCPSQKMVKYLQRSDGSLQRVDNRPGQGAIGRQGWVELVR